MASESDQPPGHAVAAPTKKSNPSTRPSEPKPLPRFNVVLLDDDDHTYDYVIEMMMKVFTYPSERGMQIARTVDGEKRAIVYTAHKELAELKRDQILGYGADPRMDTSHRSMRALIEPVD